jgi:hypothetical protein
MITKLGGRGGDHLAAVMCRTFADTKEWGLISTPSKLSFPISPRERRLLFYRGSYGARSANCISDPAVPSQVQYYTGSLEVMQQLRVVSGEQRLAGARCKLSDASQASHASVSQKNSPVKEILIHQKICKYQLTPRT